MQQLSDPHALDHARAVESCAGGQGSRGRGRLGPAVLRDQECADEIVGPHHRPNLADLVHRDLVRFNAEEAGHRRGATVLDYPVLRTGEVKRADLFPAGLDAGFGRQRGVELRAVVVNRCHGRGRTQPRDHPGGMPGRAAADPVLFQQEHVPDAELGQVVGSARSDDPAADDEDVC